VIKQLFSFDRLITPVIIRFLFYVVAAVWAVVAVIGVLGGLLRLFSDFFAGIGLILAAIILPGVFVLLYRVAAELALVVFMIRDELVWQRERQPASGLAAPASASLASPLIGP